MIRIRHDAPLVQTACRKLSKRLHVPTLRCVGTRPTASNKRLHSEGVKLVSQWGDEQFIGGGRGVGGVAVEARHPHGPLVPLECPDPVPRLPVPEVGLPVRPMRLLRGAQEEGQMCKLQSDANGGNHGKKIGEFRALHTTVCSDFFNTGTLIDKQNTLRVQVFFASVPLSRSPFHPQPHEKDTN